MQLMAFHIFPGVDQSGLGGHKERIALQPGRASMRGRITHILTQDAAESRRCDKQQSSECITASRFHASGSIAGAGAACVNIMYDSAFICIGQYEAAFIHLHYASQMSLLCLMCHLWMCHILLQSAADRSPVRRFTAAASSLFPPTPRCQRALCSTCENVKALLYSGGPPSLLLYGQ